MHTPSRLCFVAAQSNLHDTDRQLTRKESQYNASERTIAELRKQLEEARRQLEQERAKPKFDAPLQAEHERYSVCQCPPGGAATVCSTLAHHCGNPCTHRLKTDLAESHKNVELLKEALTTAAPKSDVTRCVCVCVCGVCISGCCTLNTMNVLLVWGSLAALSVYTTG